MKNTIFVERSWCKGCGLCASFCAKGVLELDGEGKAAAAHPELCVGCGTCERLCPDLAVAVSRMEEAS